MLRPYNRGVITAAIARGVSPAALFFGCTGLIGKTRRAVAPRYRYFLAALRADVDILAERNFDGFENIFFVKTESLPVGDVAHVRAQFPIGPEEIPDRRQQMLDLIVLLDELGHVAGHARRANVF